MSWLVLPTMDAAMARSAQAWLDCGFEADGTYRLWLCAAHPTDGRGALMIPATPAEAQIAIPAEAYEALLTEAERAALVADLSADWTPEIL